LVQFLEALVHLRPLEQLGLLTVAQANFEAEGLEVMQRVLHHHSATLRSLILFQGLHQSSMLDCKVQFPELHLPNLESMALNLPFSVAKPLFDCCGPKLHSVAISYGADIRVPRSVQHVCLLHWRLQPHFEGDFRRCNKHVRRTSTVSDIQTFINCLPLGFLHNHAWKLDDQTIIEE
jgi:hypothetical protein